MKAEIGGAGIISGYGLTEAPIVVMGSTKDTDEKLSTTEGRPGPGVELLIVTSEGKRAGAGEEGRYASRVPRSSRAISTPRSMPRPSTRRATSAPAT